jgi:hypothetical protein
MKFSIKGVRVETGDLVHIDLAEATTPLVSFAAAIIGIDGNFLKVASTLLTPWGHNGRFTEEEIRRITIITKAELAIQVETGFRFKRNEFVKTLTSPEITTTGKVIAAFDGTLVAQDDKGEYIVGKIEKFSEV